MLLETRLVSRKTPRDGKLEIAHATAASLAALGEELAVHVDGREGRARLESMRCTCAKGGEAGHVHDFVVSPLFTALEPERAVRLELVETPPTRLVTSAA